MQKITKNYWFKLPDLSLSHILLRIPLSFMFIQQGLNKFPFDPSGGESLGISSLVWWVVCYGEIAAGVGLMVGALGTMPYIKNISFAAVACDMLTRFCGIVMCCVVTGVIWVVLKPDSLLSFMMTDYLHFSLWAGGLYFALRGNWAVAVANVKATNASN
jgi:putative oxidoreductase